MLGFMDDLGTKHGGLVTTIGFSEAAQNRAIAPDIVLRVIPFTSVEQLVDDFVASLDFSDPRNSQYIPLL